MSLDDPIGDREAESGSTSYRFGGKERFKYSVPDFDGNALAAITNRNQKLAVLPTGGKVDRPVALDRIDRVSDDIHENLIELAYVAFYF